MGGWGVFHSFFPVKRGQKGIQASLREFFFLMFLLVFRPSAGVKKAMLSDWDCTKNTPLARVHC